MPHTELDDLDIDRGALDGTDLRGYRALMAISAVAAPAFWGLSHVLGLAYDDPLGFRLGISAAALLLLGLTYRSAFVRRHLQSIVLLLVVGVGVGIGWAAARDGLDGPGAVGVVLSAFVGGLTVTLLSTSRVEMPLSLAALAVSLVLPILLMPPAEAGYPVLLLIAAVVFMLGTLYVAGDSRLRAFDALVTQHRASGASVA